MKTLIIINSDEWEVGDVINFIGWYRVMRKKSINNSTDNFKYWLEQAEKPTNG